MAASIAAAEKERLKLALCAIIDERMEERLSQMRRDFNDQMRQMKETIPRGSVAPASSPVGGAATSQRRKRSRSPPPANRGRPRSPARRPPASPIRKRQRSRSRSSSRSRQSLPVLRPGEKRACAQAHSHRNRCPGEEHCGLSHHIDDFLRDFKHLNKCMNWEVCHNTSRGKECSGCYLRRVEQGTRFNASAAAPPTDSAD